MKSERRSTARYTIQSDEIVAMTEASFQKLRAKDISKGGMALEYTPQENEPLVVESVSIASRDHRIIFLSEINYKIIYDIETLMEGQTYSGGKRRTRGIKFIELSKEQEENLGILMKRCFENSAQ